MARKEQKPFALTPRMQQVREIYQATESIQECAGLKAMCYMEWHSMADTLHRAGVRQSCCGLCCKWRYPHERCNRFESSSVDPIGD